MKKILIVTCVSFTVVIMLFILLSHYNLAPNVTNITALQGFIMSLSIAILMFISEKLEDKAENISILAVVFIRIMICYFVVFFEGSVFKMIEFSWSGLFQISPVLIPVFLITYIIKYLICVERANSINRSIKNK